MIFCLLWGLACAGIAYGINTVLINNVASGFKTVSLYFAPFTEELLKILFIVFLIYKKKVGFITDAAIYGFAIGTGFSLMENLFYVYNGNEQLIYVWIIRGFGTAFMHGGCTALFSMLYLDGKIRNRGFFFLFIVPFVISYFIHSLFNHFYIAPIFQTIGIMIIIPLMLILIFKYNEKQLQNWLEIELNSEIELLKMIKKGQITSVRAGEYLISLKSKFSKETIFDMYCYLTLYLELSIAAKSNMILKECGFPVKTDNENIVKLKELNTLRKQIGKIGELTLAPLIRMNYRNLWKLNSL